MLNASARANQHSKDGETTAEFQLTVRNGRRTQQCSDQASEALHRVGNCFAAFQPKIIVHIAEDCQVEEIGGYGANQCADTLPRYD